jgi:hypothetical protein
MLIVIWRFRFLVISGLGGLLPDRHGILRFTLRVIDEIDIAMYQAFLIAVFSEFSNGNQG